MSTKIRAGQYILVRGRLAKMLNAFVTIEEIYERDSRKWTELQRFSTIEFLEGEAKTKIAEELIKLFKRQYGKPK